ncbi:MAG: stage II sporulation protein P [Ruminococcus sp.]|nr:stage II sporulation protein P [Ruminococcus sp.]
MTSISNDELKESSSLGAVFDIEIGSSEPQIIIYHTHTTETYELEDKDWYDADFTAKTTEPDKNMTAVGDAICEQLEAAGITVIHDTLVHDYPSYNGSYESSRETVSELLEEYPSVKIALDIHRDGIETSDGVRLAPVTEIDGKEAAQIMIISGCDDGTMDMPNYMDNFQFACALQSQIESDYSGLTRPILFDYRFYNQDLTSGSLLIEVGSHGNTLEQAVYSGELIGKALANLFT